MPDFLYYAALCSIAIFVSINVIVLVFLWAKHRDAQYDAFSERAYFEGSMDFDEHMNFVGATIYGEEEE